MIFYQNSYLDLISLYSNQSYFFPIINSVLEGKQKGKVLVDNTDNPSLFLIISNSGYSQFLRISNEVDSYQSIVRFLNEFEQFDELPKKLWIYNIPDLTHNYFQVGGKHSSNNITENSKINITERTRYYFYFGGITLEKNELMSSFSLDNIQNVTQELNLNILDKFYVSYEDAVINSFGVFLSDGNQVITTCYAAAVSNNFAEIDIVTNEKFRKMGFAKLIANHFIERCVSVGVVPVWDCYSNNLASMNTALALGFKEMYRYKCLIISK